MSSRPELVELDPRSLDVVPVVASWPDGDCSCQACLQLVAAMGDSIGARTIARKLRRRGWAGALSRLERAWLQAHPPTWWAHAATMRAGASRRAASRVFAYNPSQQTLTKNDDLSRDLVARVLLDCRRGVFESGLSNGRARDVKDAKMTQRSHSCRATMDDGLELADVVQADHVSAHLFQIVVYRPETHKRGLYLTRF